MSKKKSRDRENMDAPPPVLKALKISAGPTFVWLILKGHLGLILGLWQVQVMLVAPILLFLPKGSRAIKEAIDVWTQRK